MNRAWPLRKLKSILLSILIGTFKVPIFCFSQPVSPTDIDEKITLEIETIYANLYFNDYHATAGALTKSIALATTNNRWHLTLYGLMLKAKCAYHHNIFTAIAPILQEAEHIEKLKHSELNVLDSTYSVRGDLFYVRGLYYYTLGDFDRAIKNLEEIIKINTKYSSIDAVTLQSIYFTIGYSYFEMMLYDKANVNYEQASLLSKKDNSSAHQYQQAKGDMFLGKCKEFKGRYMHDTLLVKEALHMYRRAFKTLNTIKHEEKNKNALLSAYFRIASVYSFLKKYDSALYYLQTSLTINKEREDKIYVALGDLYKDQKKYSQALPYYNAAYTKVSLLYPNKHFEKSIPLLKKAEVLMLTHQYESALTNCQTGLTFIVKEFNSTNDIFTLPSASLESNSSQLLDAVWLKAKIFFNWSQQSGGPTQYLEESLKTYHYAIGVINDMQNNYPESTYKQDLAAKVQAFYEDALEAVYVATKIDKVTAKHVDLFFLLLESNKNTVLRESFNGTYAKSFTNIPQAILDKESSLKGIMASLKRKIYENPYNTQNEWKAALYTVSKQYDSLVAIIQSNYPEYYQLKHSKNNFSLHDLKKSLDDKTILVEYFWGDKNLYVMAVGKNKSVLTKISHAKNLATAVGALLQTIHSPAESETVSVAAFIKKSYPVYKQILEPVVANFKNKKIQSIIIIPDGVLCYLPFDMLITSIPPAQKSLSYSFLPYLLNQFTIRTLFSASSLIPSYKLKNFTNPYLGFAPAYTSLNTPLPYTTKRNKPAHLTHNETEVKQAASYFNGKTFFNERATESAFRETAHGAKILHLSMHAFTNDYDPSFSGLNFAPQDSTKEDNDGLLHLYELYNLSINADLAVLSACETGTGKYARGEGIMSLGRAFRYAGCENIVMSLWSVNDKSTTEIISYFFQNLHAGMNKDEALQQAKLSFLSAPQNKYFTHPYYWSAFIITGDTLPVTSPLSWFYVPGIMLSVLVLFLIYRGIAAYRSKTLKIIYKKQT